MLVLLQHHLDRPAECGEPLCDLRRGFAVERNLADFAPEPVLPVLSFYAETRQVGLYLEPQGADFEVVLGVTTDEHTGFPPVRHDVA